jgi:hypothetical protein
MSSLIVTFAADDANIFATVGSGSRQWQLAVGSYQKRRLTLKTEC